MLTQRSQSSDFGIAVDNSGSLSQAGQLWPRNMIFNSSIRKIDEVPTEIRRFHGKNLLSSHILFIDDQKKERFSRSAASIFLQYFS